MRQLLPVPLEQVDPFEVHAKTRRPEVEGRPWVALNMIASIDGATAIDGVSGGLGGDADRQTFHALRAIADVILVGAGTVRAEGYRAPRPSAEVRSLRLERGQSEVPRIAVVSRSLDLDPRSSMFVDAVEPPIVLTTERAASRCGRALADVAQLEAAGDTAVDVAQALDLLRQTGRRVVLCEGGPSLNAQLIAADLVDEVNVTTSPLLVAGTAARFAVGPPGVGCRLHLVHLWHDPDDDLLLARYARG